MNPRALLKAATALDALAAGRAPERSTLLQGALALDTLCRAAPERDLLDAAQGLKAIATGEPLTLDEAGRSRASELAEIVRRHAAKPTTQIQHAR